MVTQPNPSLPVSGMAALGVAIGSTCRRPAKVESRACSSVKAKLRKTSPDSVVVVEGARNTVLDGRPRTWYDADVIVCRRALEFNSGVATLAQPYRCANYICGFLPL